MFQMGAIQVGRSRLFTLGWCGSGPSGLHALIGPGTGGPRPVSAETDRCGLFSELSRLAFAHSLVSCERGLQQTQ